MKAVTVHLFDLVYGRPAAGVPVRVRLPSEPVPVAGAESDDAGSCTIPVSWSGGFLLDIDIDHYFVGLGVDGACPGLTLACRHSDNFVIYVAPFGCAMQFGSAPRHRFPQPGLENSDDGHPGSRT